MVSETSMKVVLDCAIESWLRVLVASPSSASLVCIACPEDFVDVAGAFEVVGEGHRT